MGKQSLFFYYIKLIRFWKILLFTNRI